MSKPEYSVETLKSAARLLLFELPRNGFSEFQEEDYGYLEDAISSCNTAASMIGWFQDVDESMREPVFDESDYTPEELAIELAHLSIVQAAYAAVEDQYGVSILELAGRKSKALQKVIDRGEILSLSEYRLVSERASGLPVTEDNEYFSSLNQMMYKFEEQMEK